MDLLSSYKLDELFEKWTMLTGHRKQQQLIMRKIKSNLDTVEMLIFLHVCKEKSALPSKMEPLMKRINKKLTKRFNMDRLDEPAADSPPTDTQKL
jgi:hypothetical protein